MKLIIIFALISISQSLNIVNEEDFKNACNNGTLSKFICDKTPRCSTSTTITFIVPLSIGWGLAIISSIIIRIIFVYC